MQEPTYYVLPSNCDANAIKMPDPLAVDPNAQRSTMTATSRVDIGTFSGTGGLVTAETFVTGVDYAMSHSGMEDARMAALVKNAIKGHARVWLEILLKKRTPGLDKWSTLKTLFMQRWCRQLAVVQLAEMESSLTQQQGEPVEHLYERCERYVLEDNADLTEVEMRQSGMIKMTDRYVKKLFLKGLRRDVREAMVIKTKDASADEIKESAMAAEEAKNRRHGATAEQASFLGAAPVAIKSEPGITMAAVDAKIEQAVAAVSGGGWKSSSASGSGGQRKKGQPNPKIPAASRDQAPSREVLSKREKKLCERCGAWSKHRTHECYASLEKGGSNRSSYKGSGVGAMSASEALEDAAVEEFVVRYAEPQFLN